MKKLLIIACLVVLLAQIASAAERIERWGVFEIALKGPAAGNPFTDVQLSAEFKLGDAIFRPEGFYDGDGVFKIRFMPNALGTWSYVTKSNHGALDGKKGDFVCVPPSKDNHGPVLVSNTHYLAYADGTPHFSVGTTCYAWPHQGDRLETQTLETLKTAPFNKMRMCVFPKDYVYNKNEPQFYPFQGTPLKNWDYTRFNPAFWRHFEKRIIDLMELGIEADIILFHPYDRWGYQNMNAQADDHYLRYAVARLAAYRNVWWSFANEFDFMKAKTTADWDRFFQIVQKHDPYNRLRGIHNGRDWYDHTKPWVTHASIQSSNFTNVLELRRKYNKPLLYDECRYEGDIPQGWGNITAKQMVRNFWLGTLSGAYVGHGETYKHPEDILWWSKGGVLHGESPARIHFLKQIMADAPQFETLIPDDTLAKGHIVLHKPGEFYMVYFPTPGNLVLNLPGDRPYKIDGIDTWNMTVTPIGTARPGEFRFAPPTEDYLLRLSPYKPGEKLRPEARAAADPTEGIAPLKVRFSTPAGNLCRWDFGDNNGSSERNPEHVYDKPGLYTATLTITDDEGLSATTSITIAADRNTNEPIVRVGCRDNNYPTTKLNGKIEPTRPGYELADGEPWKWIAVGDAPIEDLEGLRSFTIMGWLKPSSLNTGSGGNRIAFNLNYNRSGFDLVHQQDGRLRLAVNEWPDSAKNDSSPGKLMIDKWVFFAVTYDAAKTQDNVCWYFGDEAAPAGIDRKNTYSKGSTGKGSGPLTIGNYNETIHQHGKDRQFRGQIRGIRIFGSRISSQGALSQQAIRREQKTD
ncbi:MAG: DUF5060 domain-containing protein [Phycisphaerae bacterium]|nr:DUF5060 domain-containing protein [Phycisphaerae bacterium]